MVHDALSGFPIVVSIPVQWGEQDMFGHVNNVYYLRWCESARIEYLNRIAIFDWIKRGNTGPIMANVSCNFRKPVVHPDTVHIGAKVTKIGRTSFTMEHVLVSDRLGVVADSTSVLVMYDYSAGKPHPLPEEIRAAIESLEDRV
jgi:acyl-CoA thioester hydrolase